MSGTIHTISAPLATHWRPATCAQVGCEQYRAGWRLRLEGLSDRDLAAVDASGRRYVREEGGPGETWLVFEAGQACFRSRQHRLPSGRAELYVVRRQFSSAQQLNAADWADSLQHETARVAAARERG